MSICEEDEILVSLFLEFTGIPTYFSTNSKKVCKENADCCAVIADRCEELGLIVDALHWRGTESAYREREKRAKNP